MTKYIIIIFSTLFLFSCYNNVEKSEKEKVDCYTKKELEVRGDSMHPMIKDGAVVELYEGYYDSSKCNNDAKKGDLVVHKFGMDKTILKQVRVGSEDVLEIVDNRLLINNEEMLNSAGERYFFSESDIKMLSIYITDGKIPENTFFIFSDNVSEEVVDSRKFGAVSQLDFLGKVNLK